MKIIWAWGSYSCSVIWLLPNIFPNSLKMYLKICEEGPCLFVLAFQQSEMDSVQDVHVIFEDLRIREISWIPYLNLGKVEPYWGGGSRLRSTKASIIHWGRWKQIRPSLCGLSHRFWLPSSGMGDSALVVAYQICEHVFQTFHYVLIGLPDHPEHPHFAYIPLFIELLAHGDQCTL